MCKLPKMLKDDFMAVYTPNTIPAEKRDARLLDKMLKEKDGIVLKALNAFRDCAPKRN